MSVKRDHSPFPTSDVLPPTISRPDGTPLTSDVRASMERRFSADFADVRVHTNERAGHASRQLGARAFTLGRDITFAPGHFQPGTRKGLGLLAHELTHVVQQRGTHALQTATAAQVAPSHSRAEVEAEHNERASASPAPLRVTEQADAGLIHRSPGIIDELRVRASGNLETMVNYLLAHSERANDPLVVELNEYRAGLRGVDVVEFEPAAAAELEAVYQQAKAKAPSWVPVPQLNFTRSERHPATASVTILEALLIIGLILLILFLFLMFTINFLKETSKGLRGGRTRRKPTGFPDTKAKPEEEPVPKPGPRPPPSTGPTPPIPPERREPEEYPICWATQLGPPLRLRFVRVKSERDEDEATQARLALRWRQEKDPSFNAREYHVHHIVPLFLDGIDNLDFNGTVIPGRVHLRGHAVLRKQPQMLTPPPGLPPLSDDLYDHPPGIRYRLVGFKKEPGESCP